MNAVHRDRLTLRTYLAFICLGWMLNGLGAILPALQADLGADRATVARYPAMFGVGRDACTNQLRRRWLGSPAT